MLARQQDPTMTTMKTTKKRRQRPSIQRPQDRWRRHSDASEQRGNCVASWTARTWRDVPLSFRNTQVSTTPAIMSCTYVHKAEDVLARGRVSRVKRVNKGLQR